MKTKLLLLLLLPAFMTLSCTNGNEPQTGPGSINVIADELIFPSEGGTLKIMVEVENLDSWKAYSKMSWIKLGEPDIANGSLEITVEPTEEIDDLVSSVVIFSETEDTAVVSITQKGNGVIHDRSSLKRMNLRGDIESLSFYFNPTYIWEQKPTYLTDLKFNEKGLLTDFKFNETEHSGETYDYTAEVSYDEHNRISSLYIYTAVAIGTGVFEYVLDFTYGNHGKYIETSKIFEYLSVLATSTAHRMWMPAMIKDLTKISIRNTGLSLGAVDMLFETSGDSIISYLSYKNDGQTVKEEQFIYDFEGPYTSTNTYRGVFAGSNVKYVLQYNVAQESGYLKETKLFLEMINGFLITEKTFDMNLANSLLFYGDAMDYGYNMWLTYDDYYYITAIDEHTWGMNATFDYTYDEYGNWTSVKSTCTPRATFAFDEDITIVYRN